LSYDHQPNDSLVFSGAHVKFWGGNFICHRIAQRPAFSVDGRVTGSGEQSPPLRIANQAAAF